jgi:hypothetical protein
MRAMEIRKKDTLVCMAYNSIWDTLQFKGGLLCRLVSLIQIGSVTLMIEIILHIMFSVFVLDLSFGLVRNNKLFLFIYRSKLLSSS